MNTLYGKTIGYTSNCDYTPFNYIAYRAKEGLKELYVPIWFLIMLYDEIPDMAFQLENKNYTLFGVSLKLERI